MKTKRHEINMTEGSILKSIISFAIPMMMSSMLQIFFNAADLIVVSRWTGSLAMASVGSTSQLTSLVVNLFLGMAIGSTVTISRCYGAKDPDGIHRAVHTSVLFSIIIGLTAFTLGQILCKPLLLITGTPSGEVLDGAVLYMRIVFFGTPATVIYNYSAAALRSVGDNKRPLYILAISGVVNFVLNLIFVIFFNMGVSGVAAATAISKYLSVFLLFRVLTRKDHVCRVQFKKLRIYKSELLSIIKIGLPAGVYNIMTSFTNVIIQSSVNSFGAAAIAGNAAAANIENFTACIKVAFRQATVTAVGQNYGAKKPDRMLKSVKVSLACITVSCLVLGALMVVFAKQLLGIYITDSSDAIRYGTIRLVLTAIPYFLSGVMQVTSGYLRGVGYSTLTTVNAFVGMIAFRVVYVLFVFPIFGTFESLYIGTPITWIIVCSLNIISIMVVKDKVAKKMYQK